MSTNTGKSSNTVNPRYSKLSIGVCPDQWGVWYPHDERQIEPRKAMGEMAQAGFEILETGPYGYFPTDPATLGAWTREFGMRIVAGTGWGILHREDAWAQTERHFRDIAATHAAVGARYIVYLPPMARDEKTWEWIDHRHLTAGTWGLYMSNANRLGRILKEDYGLQLLMHPHGDSHIETPRQIERMLEDTDPEYVNLCLDTGHVVYGGGDPVKMVGQFADRIPYVHIKAFDPRIVREAHDMDWPFNEAIAHGAAVTPPDGKPDMHRLVNALADLDKHITVICEQDLYPTRPDVPLPNAINVRRFLACCGLGML
ncbi:2-keto-myo-inositol dehydratase [Bifidobacterium callitrichos]|uniref:2-keto-myo-inositol dehydratase n=1 Tax=Bifidobacterium callitrichos TaxID=762209 RepID=A0A2T3GD73_9BIFI|nr:TIM barrel protein [Bifidobacterium callitrichos]KAA8815791.1 2-keto-myo-inositol dehydratase [Bifidobacterium callitrichos]PST47412.1 2-keto-myo-inositol dehydratase [Bifidobacterium callitrichos]